MSYTERTYIQNANSCVRNKDLLNIRMSSDWCEFTPPTVDVSGATKIQPVSATSEGVYLLTGETGTTLCLVLTGGPTPYSASSADGVVEFFQYDTNVSGFTNPYVYQIDDISLSGDLTTFIDKDGNTLYKFCADIPYSAVTPDNEYLIKTYFNFDACTEFLNILGVRYDNKILTGDKYSLYNDDFDYYISVSYSADTPELEVSSFGSNNIFGGLVAYSRFPSISGQTDFTLQSYVDEVMVSLNGLTLAPNYDYTITGGIVTISAGTELTDVVTFVHSIGGSDYSGLVNDFIEVGTITSGATGGQGTNDVYYNTTEGKYEVYTSVSVESSSDVVVTLNGVTLANNIDYYKSISNNKRIILEGTIITGDIINIYYFSNATYVGNIYTNAPLITWSIQHAPTLVNGQFTLQLSSANTFSDIVFSSVTDYVVDKYIYSDNLIVTGTVGTQYYYRVMNEKFYQPITGNTIDTVAYSETIPIIIQSNAINSY